MGYPMAFPVERIDMSAMGVFEYEDNYVSVESARDDTSSVWRVVITDDILNQKATIIIDSANLKRLAEFLGRFV